MEEQYIKYCGHVFKVEESEVEIDSCGDTYITIKAIKCDPSSDLVSRYCHDDKYALWDAWNRFYGGYRGGYRNKTNFSLMPGIKKVIFNDPATIVLWNDNTKTIVKCQKGDKFDPEKGLAMAVSKKALGRNTGKYYEEFKPWFALYYWKEFTSRIN